MLRESLQRWVAAVVGGEVTLELRRGDDYTILDTNADRSAYDPAKLSMEKTASAFSPEDRIGALEMQTLGVMDNRELLLHVAKTLGRGVAGPLGGLLLGDGEEDSTERSEDQEG
jgi:argininosuccinate synthase